MSVSTTHRQIVLLSIFSFPEGDQGADRLSTVLTAGRYHAICNGERINGTNGQVSLIPFAPPTSQQTRFMNDNTALPPFSKVNLVIFVGLPIIALFAVPAWGIYHGYTSGAWLWTLIFLYLNGLSITGGHLPPVGAPGLQGERASQAVLRALGRGCIAKQYPCLGFRPPPPSSPRG